VAAADPFLDLVGRMFENRCSSCHNSDKRESDLDLTNHAGVMRGGETGTVITAGRAEVSELLRRISLPEDDEEFMPAEGKTPLTDAQVRIIEWWIRAGAPTGTSIGALGTPPDPEIEGLISAELGLGS
jgi:mono/diheme cytochrome c family protein